MTTAEVPAPRTAPPSGGRALAALAAEIRRDRPALVGGALVAAVVLAPVAALLVIAFRGDDNVWPHILSTVLPNAIADTAALLAGVGIGVAVIGVATAWLTATCRFPGQRLFDWALLLPLAIPTYIVAYCYVELFDSFGPVQTALRDLAGFKSRQDYWFPEIRSLGGAILVMTAVLYPYVYLCARAVFLMQSASLLDAARTLGCSRGAAFRRIAVPLARPAVAVGVALALMETLNDMGATEYLGVRSLAVSVYATWVNRGSLSGAAQIACVMLLVVFALVALERVARRRQRYTTSGHRAHQPAAPVELRGWHAAGAVLACGAPLAFGFLVPAGFLVREALTRLADQGLPDEFLGLMRHSVGLAATAAAIVVAVGFVLAHAEYHARGRGVGAIVRLTGLGYALPGTVLAVGAMVPLAGLDNMVDGWMRQSLGVSTGLLVMGSGSAIVYAYVVRFLAVATGVVESGFQKISPHMEMAARTLGRTAAGALREVELPLMRPAVATAALLVFVDAMKELPATLLLRPFNFDTLATNVYGFANRGTFEDGAIAALTIVLVGLAPVILLARMSRLPLDGGSAPSSAATAGS